MLINNVGDWSEKMQQLLKLNSRWVDLLRYQFYYLYKNSENYREEDILGEETKGERENTS